MPDKFPEAFSRFQQDVPTRQIETFNQLTLAFASWAGQKWRDTSRQLDALAIQARKLGIPVADYYMREQRKWDERRQWDEAIYSEAQETGFSIKYSSFQQWQSKTARTTAYERRIINYVRNHPNASLAEARGHRTKKPL
jgi:hypothetical protein